MVALTKALAHQKAVREGGRDNPGQRKRHLELYLDLASTLVVQGKHQRIGEVVTEVAPQLKTLGATTADHLQLAAWLARCMVLAAADTTLSDQQQRERREAFAVQAVAQLRMAYDGGWRDLKMLSLEAQAVLQGRTDYERLVQELKGEKVP